MKLCNELVRELSSIYDKESMNTFVSLYFDGRNKEFIEKREKACKMALEKEELKNFIKTMEEIKTYLKRKAASNVAIFASYKHNFFKAVLLPEVKNLLVVDSSPYILPLAEMLDEWENFILLLMNYNHAKIYSMTYGEVKEKELSADIMNKHKKGGWSQARFQRIRKGEIHAFFVEIIEELEKMGNEAIIIAGDGIAKKEFERMLPDNLKSRVIASIDIDMRNEEELLKESTNVMAERERNIEYNLLQKLRKEIIKDGLAVYGVDDVIEKARNGQIEMLMVEKDYKLKGWICERCQALGKGKVTKCLYCGKQVSEVNVIEEIIEFAERTNASIEFIENEEMEKIGHIAALLRYK